jgi:general secretion pathway protein K
MSITKRPRLWLAICSRNVLRLLRVFVEGFARYDVSRQRGFALLIVLWSLALLSFLTAHITASSHLAALTARNIRGSAVAEAAADGAVYVAIFHALESPGQRWLADGAARVIRGSRAVAEVRIEDEGAKIDLNVAPGALLQALLHTCGVAPSTALRLAGAIYDWRALDLSGATSSAKIQQYMLAGLSYVPPSAKFVSVDEVGLVLGMTPALLACLGPHITVYSSSIPMLQTTTDPVVRQALAEAYPEDTMHPRPVLPSNVAVIRITATAQEATGGQFRRIAVVGIVPARPSDDFAYKILLWEQGAS